MDKNEYSQMSHDVVVRHCKHWAGVIREVGVDTLTSDESAVSISDQLCYPLEMQSRITPESEPILYAISVYAVRVDNNYTESDSWEKLLKLIDIL
jgi:hypothetical protein